MQDSRLKNIVRNIFSGIVLRLVSILMPFLVRTFMIRTLGGEYLGLNSLFVSVLQVLSVSELGFNTAMVYSMYKPIAQNDDDKVCALLNLYKKFYRLVGLIVLISGLITLPFIKHFIKGTPPSNINVYYVYLIFLFNTTVSYFLFTYKGALLNAVQRVDIANYISVTINIVMYVSQIVVIVLIKNYYIYILLLPISMITNNLIMAWITKKKYPQYVCGGKLKKEDIREIRKRVIALLGNRIGGTVTNSADSIVISSFIGLTSLAIYSNYYYIISSINGIIVMMFSSMTASIGNKMCTADSKTNYKDFHNLFFINQWIVGWCSVCLLCLLQNFTYLWVGSKYMYPFPVVISFVIYFCSWQIRRTALIYKDAGGFWWEDRIRPYVLAIINVCLNVFFVTRIGIYGVIFSTVIAQMISFPWESKVLFKYFERNLSEYIRKTSIYVTIMIVACTVTYSLCSFVGETTILSLIIRIAICCVVPNLIYYITYRGFSEFKNMKMLIIRFYKKLKRA